MIESVEVMIKQPGHADRVVRLSEGATRMGRAEDNEIVLSDVGVSRRHAQVYVSRGEVTVEDLGSGNGTYYNGYRIQSQPVQDGDEIVIDPFVLHFKVRGQERGGRADENRAGSTSAPARLQVVVGSGMAGSSYPITSRGLSIGRSEDRDVVIADPAASRHHCQINLQGGEYVLRDMGSANGVFVNAVRVRECTLADGDLVRIGNTEMRFVRFEGSGADLAPHQAPSSQQDYQQEAYGQPSGRQRTQAQWNEPAQHSDPYGAEPEPRRRSSTPIFAMLFGGLIVFVGFVTVLLFVIVAVVFLLKYQVGSQVRTQPASPPRWALTLPTGLEPAPVDALFKQGQEKMQERNNREALQDFYRVLQADPGHASVDKFAFAAGEFLVVDTLEKELQRRAEERVKRDAERDALLADFRDGNRDRQLKAAQRLKSKFREDPKVMEALELEPSKQLIGMAKLTAEGTEFMAQTQYDEASNRFQDVLDGSKDPTARNQALSSLKLSQKEVARASAEKWQRAVLAAASGDRSTAKSLFLELKEEHPANASVKFHLERLQ